MKQHEIEEISPAKTTKPLKGQSAGSERFILGLLVVLIVLSLLISGCMVLIMTMR